MFEGFLGVVLKGVEIIEGIGGTEATARWLALGVRTNGNPSGAFTALTPLEAPERPDPGPAWIYGGAPRFSSLRMLAEATPLPSNTLPKSKVTRNSPLLTVTSRLVRAGPTWLPLLAASNSEN